MKKTLIASLLLLSIASHAAKVEDVKVLEIKSASDLVELKLQVKDGKPDSYFKVAISKSDERSFEKLSLVLQKIKNPNSFNLILDIPSFSPSPSGSFYKSEGVNFTGSPK